MRFNTLHHIHKMFQNCWRKSVLNTQNPELPGRGGAPRGPLPGLCPVPAEDFKRSPDPSPTFVLPNTKSWIRPRWLFICGCRWCGFYAFERTKIFRKLCLLITLKSIELTSKIEYSIADKIYTIYLVGYKTRLHIKQVRCHHQTRLSTFHTFCQLMR
jgi:hypothetical protein